MKKKPKSWVEHEHLVQTYRESGHSYQGPEYSMTREKMRCVDWNCLYGSNKKRIPKEAYI